MIGYLDCTSGISGDKLLAALVSAGASAEAVRSAVAAIDPAVHVEFTPVVRGGIAALSVTVTAPPGPLGPPHRAWRDVRELLASAALPAPVRARALEAFTLLAEAEAAVHETSADEVTFHEVGAIDSIADVVGTCAALHALGLDALVCGRIAVGSGTVSTAHGMLPVPAPATALLLRGVPIETGPAPGEATTPTGAALVRACATSFGPLPAMTPTAVGHGAGTREVPELPNVARLILGEAAAPAPAAPAPPGPLAEEPVTELVTTVDHLSAEHLADALARVLAAGALDAWHAPAVMKKGRLGASVSVLCSPAEEVRLATLLFELTGTLGIRVRRLSRFVIAREQHVVTTSFGPVRVKVAGSGSARRVRAEYDDLAAIAEREAMPVDRVARIVEALAAEELAREQESG